MEVNKPIVIAKVYEMCYMCMEKHHLEYVEVTEINTYKGISVTSKMHYEHCDRCDEYCEGEFLMALNRRSMLSAYEEIINKKGEII